MMLHRLRTWIKDERGTSVIELGIAAPVLSFMLIGVVDVTRAITAKFALERAAQSAIETVQQQGWSDSAASKTALETEAKTRAGTGATATASSELQCWNGASKTTTTFSGSCSNGAAEARYVKILVNQNFTFLWGINWGAGSSKTYSLQAEASVRVQ